MTSRLSAAVIGATLAVCLASGARAQIDLGPDTVHGLIEVRASAADGEASFAGGAFGKTLYGGTTDGGWRPAAGLAEAALEWRPRFTWAWSAVVDAVAQPGRPQPVDLLQAYIVYKPVPRSATRVWARLGFFYPPISLEHDGPVWGLTNTITPSAINSWVGEEVKVVGLEGSASRDFGGQSLEITAGLFGYDDTAGTLITYRGWALHDLKATAFGSFDLPPLSAFALRVQNPYSYSTREIDHRLGGYGRIEWRPSPALSLDAFHYDNRGDKVSFTGDLQWAWQTQFTNLGLRWKIGDRTRLLAQALTGTTRMGFVTPDGLFADVTFRSAYALAARDVGAGALTARLDIFQVVDHSLRAIDNNDERGWALTGAWRHPIGPHADLRLEALHVWSHRPSRAYGGLASTQAQTVLQSSLRAFF